MSYLNLILPSLSPSRMYYALISLIAQFFRHIDRKLILGYPKSVLINRYHPSFAIFPFLLKSNSFNANSPYRYFYFIESSSSQHTNSSDLHISTICLSSKWHPATESLSRNFPCRVKITLITLLHRDTGIFGLSLRSITLNKFSYYDRICNNSPRSDTLKSNFAKFSVKFLFAPLTIYSMDGSMQLSFMRFGRDYLEDAARLNFRLNISE